MKIPIDTHTHSISSGHAFSTVEEMARGAKENGVEMFVLAEHAPSMPGGPHIFHFNNMVMIPPYLEGVRVLRGAELNILDFEGAIDLPERNLKKLEFIVASLHNVCIEPGSREQNTMAMVRALQNPYIDVIGHPGNPYYELDVETVVKKTGELGKLVEINNHSFLYRKGSGDVCRGFIRLCKKHGVRITLASDAHIRFEIGDFEAALEALREEKFPEELIVNARCERFEEYLRQRAVRIDDAMGASCGK